MNKETDQLIRDGIFCPIHNYVAGSHKLPTKGCKQCWRAWYTDLVARFPLDDQPEILKNLKHIVTSIIKDPKSFDYKPERPQIIPND